MINPMGNKKYSPHISALLLTFILIFVVGGVLFPKTTYAKINCFGIPGDGDEPRPPGLTDAQCIRLAGGPGSSVNLPSAITDPAQKILKFGAGILLAPLGWLALLILQIATLLTDLAGMILNYATKVTIVEMSENIRSIGAIDIAWKTIRDVANMGFIFVLLYAAIQTILGIGSDTKKLIVNIIVVAILINFSLFFTKVVIDASNVLSNVFYDAIAPTSLTDPGINVGLSGKMMGPLKLTSLWDTGNIGVFTTKGNIIIGLMGTIVSLVVAFVFFAVAIMLVIRFVVLIFVMILSPLAFMGYILPQLKKHKDDWVQALLGQAFFAPIYFMLTWIVIRISEGLLPLTGASTGGTMATAFLGAVGADGNTTPPPPGSIALLLNFIIVIVFLIASLVIAKQWANRAGHGVPGLTKWATGLAGGAVFGGAAKLTRETVGRGAEKFKDSDVYRRMQMAAPTSRLARLGLATANKTASGSFDLRGAYGIGGQLSGVEAGGPSGTGGYEAKVKQKQTQAAQRTKVAQTAQNRTAINNAMTTGTPAAIATVRNNVRRLSNDDVQKLPAAYLANPDLTTHMKSTQADAIHDSDNFTQAQKTAFTTARQAPVNAAIAAGNIVNAQQALMRLSAKEVNRIPMTGAGLRNPTIVSAYTPSMLRRMTAELDPNDIATLRGDILVGGDPNTINWLNSPDGQATFS